MKKTGFGLLAALGMKMASAAIIGNAASQALVAEGDALGAHGKFQAAVDKYSAAAKADPAASAPLSALAALLYRLSTGAAPEGVPKLRQQSEGMAQAALDIDGKDPVALEVQRMLADAKGPPLHQANPEAAALLEAGEVLFAQRQHAQALEKYLKAAQADPATSTPLMFAGDCYYVQEKWAEAEQLFAQAVRLEPLNAQAWRYLADALGQQGKLSAAEAALLSGIAAQPSQLPTWTKLASLRAQQGAPLQPLQLVRKARSRIDTATGKGVVEVESGGPQSPDMTVWIALAVSEANHMVEQHQGKSTESAFAMQLAAWADAMRVADGLGAGEGGELTSPSLKAMRMLAQAGQLEPAILLLQYKEAYRADLERWKAEHPNGVKKFVDMYGLRP